MAKGFGRDEKLLGKKGWKGRGWECENVEEFIRPPGDVLAKEDVCMFALGAIPVCM
jgi:hypothetical protein